MNGRIKHTTVKNILKLRLNMFELKCNYKGVRRSETCDLCKKAKDTTEHLFECKKIKKVVKNVPKFESLDKIDEEDACMELGKFLDEVCTLREIDSKKSIRENLQKKSRDKYTSKNISKDGKIKLVITLPKIRYRVKHTKGLKMKIQRR